MPIPDAAEVMRALLLLEREAGTPDATEARELLAGHFSALGFQVEAQRFAFSTGMLHALPILGAGLGWLGVLAVPLLLSPGVPAWVALAAWGLGLGALLVIVAGVALGWAPARGERREDATLVIRRPGAVVTRWLVAHMDTKCQRQSMAGRLITLWLLGLAVAAMSAVTVARLWMRPGGLVVAGAAGAVLGAGALAARARLKGRTVGARDNASGIAALLAAAESSGPGTGYLLTGAEEFGLVGARILAQQLPDLVRGTDVINVDTVDDRGGLYLVAHDSAGMRLASELVPALSDGGVPVRRRRLPVGILVDSLPLARAGARAITVARLDWSTLRMLHTARDSAEAVRFETAARLGARLGALR